MHLARLTIGLIKVLPLSTRVSTSNWTAPSLGHNGHDPDNTMYVSKQHALGWAHTPPPTSGPCTRHQSCHQCKKVNNWPKMMCLGRQLDGNGNPCSLFVYTASYVSSNGWYLMFNCRLVILTCYRYPHWKLMQGLVWLQCVL